MRQDRREPSIPKDLRRDVTQHARAIAKKYRSLFIADRQLKDRVMQLERALLPPRPRRRGRPGDPDVTHAIQMFRRFRRQYAAETPRQLWSRIYPFVIPGYDNMTKLEQRTKRETLQERIAWRRRKRRPRKIPAEISIS